jgi:N,N-dimethylformamidase
VICGDPNPDGPGIKEEDHTSVFAGTYTSRVQPVSLGSYARVPHAHAFDGLNQFTVIATIWPTTSQARRQGLVAKYDAVSGAGFALYIDERGAGACLGTGSGKSFSSRVGKPLRERSWYTVWTAFDASTRTLSVGQFPLQPSVGADDAGSVSMTSPGSASAVLETPVPLLIAALGGSPVTGHFNGKIEGPTILERALDADDIATAATAQSDLIAHWDFSSDISSAHIVDVGPHGLQGELINLPARAMTGSNWTGEEMCWRHAPEQYGAIHFHEDDIYDCGWETDFRFTVPEGLKSGMYAMRLTCGALSDTIPFFVRPKLGQPTSTACVLVPTLTYTVYSNYARGSTTDVYRERTAAWGAREWTADDHRDYGLSTYNFHSDGSGIGYASYLRPMLTVRPGFLSYHDPRGSGLRHLPADTHLFDWLEAMGHDVDVITDHDLHAEGIDLLAPYKVVMTASHPEYHTKDTLDAITAYTERGGRLMYLGGNGFYWRVAVHPEWPGAVEIRRNEGGIRAWAAEPGEYYHSFDGQYGGLWRRNGRPPQQLAGVGFTSQGLFEGSYYRRQPGVDDPRAAWIFAGVEDEILGDFGLSGGGAAGFELDRVDTRLGTPPHALILATSEAHQPENFVVVHEEMLTMYNTVPGLPAASLIHADMVYFETPNGGAVFSVGSITFCGSLAHHHYDNNISRIVNNVLTRFRE